MGSLERNVSRMREEGVPEDVIMAFIDEFDSSNFAIQQKQEPMGFKDKAIGAANDYITTTRNIGEQPGEIAANIATSAYGAPLAGLAGVGRFVGSSLYKPFAEKLGLPYEDPLESASKRIEEVQEDGNLIYHPQTQAGKQVEQTMGYPMEKLDQLGGYVGSKIDDPKAAGLVHTIIAGSPALVMRKGKGSANAKINRRIRDTSIDGFKKSVKPPPSKQKTATQRSAYNDNILTTMEGLVKNRKDYKLLDEGGAVREGLPETMLDMSEAIYQRKNKIYEDFNSMVMDETGKGVQIDTSPIVSTLERIKESKTTQIHNPNLIPYIEEYIKRIESSPVSTPIEIQAFVKDLNSKLKTFYANPESSMKTFRDVDAKMILEYRRLLNERMENAGHAKYGEMRKEYGAYAAIEEDVARRAAAIENSSGQNIGMDLADIYTAGQISGGIVSGNLPMVMQGAGAKATKIYLKARKDADKIVKKMFKKVGSDFDKLYVPQTWKDSNQYQGPREQTTPRQIEWKPELPRGEGVINLPKGPIPNQRLQRTGGHRSAPPKPINAQRGQLVEGETYFPGDVKASPQQLTPSQLGLVRKGKAGPPQSNVGSPLTQPAPGGHRSPRMKPPDVKPVPKPKKKKTTPKVLRDTRKALDNYNRIRKSQGLKPVTLEELLELYRRK